MTVSSSIVVSLWSAWGARLAGGTEPPSWLLSEEDGGNASGATERERSAAGAGAASRDSRGGGGGAERLVSGTSFVCRLTELRFGSGGGPAGGGDGLSSFVPL